MSGNAGKGVSPMRLLRRARDYRQLRRLRRPEPRRGVVVATVQNEAIARVIAGRLTDEGIKAFVFEEDAGTGAVPIPVPVHVIVRPEDEADARRVLADYQGPAAEKRDAQR